MLYSEKVMDHFKNPRNVGEIEDADGVGEVGNPVCGDIMKMYLKIENDVIVDCKFKTFGCGSAIATSSMATELIKGKTVQEALELSNKAVVEALDGLPARKIHCSVLAEEAIKSALVDYYTRKGLELPEEIKDLIAFYETPLGKKIIEKTPELTLRSAQVGQNAVAKHLLELQNELKKAIETEQKKSAAPAVQSVRQK